tara:strand:+ start:13095 stop:14198 length:1104 start_codon:yes stop_codon:yes gene_type:complete
MRVLVTGSEGFIGKNLIVRLNEMNILYDVFNRKNSTKDLPKLIKRCNFIVHLAGENRPNNDSDYDNVNVGLTKLICDEIRKSDKNIPLIFSSSTQVNTKNLYGKSKLNAELEIRNLEIETGNKSHIYRLPGVFGKWSKPNYNSVVATFCNNIGKDLPIQINDPEFELKLVYIDDVIEEFINKILGDDEYVKDPSVSPEYQITLGDLADQIKNFKISRDTLITEKVGTGFVRKLYSTYLSFLSPDKFSYSIPTHGDERGMFAEMLKTKDSGQFSFFTAGPGVTRGGHYHHSKTEKFLILHGKAKFKFRHLITNKKHEIVISHEELRIVETMPGWVHDITNIGDKDMIVMLWANEIFNPEKPDTFANSL